ncbi:MAG: MFS transporter [Candidatus Sumerlaeaceae bacterium]|nr:MFS transporter [Candidatus Sumerlaeaceae bacterium]
MSAPEDTTDPPQRIHPRAAFQHRDFTFFQAAKFLFTIGGQMQFVAVSWQVYDFTKKPMDLGFIGLVLFMPAFLFSLATGHAADRFDRRKVMIVCFSALALSSLTLLFLTNRGLSNLWPIYFLLFFIGTAHAFVGPASQALMPQLVPQHHFHNAVTWNSSMWQLARIAGPSLGGVILHYGHGPASVYAADAILTGLGLLLLLAIKTRTGRMETAAATWETLIAGLKYVRRNPVLFGAISLDLFAVLFGGVEALLPIFAKEVLQVGERGFGALRAAPALGAAFMAITLTHLPPFRKAGATMFWCVAGFGLFTIVFALSKNFFLSLACLVLLGAFDMVSVVVRHTLVQLKTPPAMRGRVSAVNLVFIGASNELGQFESGLTAKWFGTVPAAVVGGICTLVVVGVCAWAFPPLRKFGRLDTAHHEDSDEAP